MAASAAQAWAFTTFTFGTSLAKAYVNTPTAGNLLLCVGVQESDASTDLNISDNMTDGGTWAAVSTIGAFTNATLNGLGRAWWKVVGGSANSNKTVTIAPPSGSIAMDISIVEYTSNLGAVTWTENGTPTKATTTGANPSPGNVVTSGSGDYVIVGAVIALLNCTAGTGYTRRVDDTDNFAVDIEDRFTTAAATETPAWASAINTATSAGFAFRAAAAGGAANRIRFPSQQSAMGVGGMLGGNRVSRSIFIPRNLCLR